MKSILKPLVFLFFVLVVIGFFRGWFSMSGSNRTIDNKMKVELILDREKAGADAKTVSDEAKELSGSGKRAAE